LAEQMRSLAGLEREAAYRILAEQIDRVLEGIDDVHAEMATVAAMVHHGLGTLWTGFYRVVEPGRLLRVGPYQGTLGCLEIAFSHGVCGTAAATRQAVLVPDVNAFPGHIACDARSRAEIVLPVVDSRGELIAVLDIDSETPAAFDERDRIGLERILARFARTRRPSLPG
jgi:GAF domain-containing protein